jgi:hypothetical protein
MCHPSLGISHLLGIRCPLQAGLCDKRDRVRCSDAPFAVEAIGRQYTSADPLAHRLVGTFRCCA